MDKMTEQVENCVVLVDRGASYQDVVDVVTTLNTNATLEKTVKVDVLDINQIMATDDSDSALKTAEILAKGEKFAVVNGIDLRDNSGDLSNEMRDVILGLQEYPQKKIYYNNHVPGAHGNSNWSIPFVGNEKRRLYAEILPNAKKVVR